MKAKTISKLLATGIFALTASAAWAAPDATVGFTWDTDPDSFTFQHGDYWPHENHESYTKKHNNKYKMWSVGGVVDTRIPANETFVVGAPNEVRWGYGGQKKRAIDYTRRSGSDDYRTSGVVINGDNTLTYWNNFLDEDFYTLTSFTLNVSFTLDGVTVYDSITMYTERANEKPKKNGAIDVDHGGSFLIFDADLTFVHVINGVTYEFSFDDIKITDVYNNKDITAASLSNDCDYGLSSCYVIGGNVKSSTKNTEYLISFGDVTVVPEPETYAMLLAGLGLVGVMVRRRSSTLK